MNPSLLGFLLAQADAANQQAQQGPNPLVTMFIMLAPLILVFYLLILRPERKRQQERQRMLRALKPKRRVVTIGGIKGVVTKVREEDDEVEIRVDDRTGTRLRVTRSSIAWVERKDEDEETEKQEKAEAKGGK